MSPIVGIRQGGPCAVASHGIKESPEVLGHSPPLTPELPGVVKWRISALWRGTRRPIPYMVVRPGFIYSDSCGSGRVSAIPVVGGVRYLGRTHLPAWVTDSGAGISEYELAAVLIGLRMAICLAHGRPRLLCRDNMGAPSAVGRALLRWAGPCRRRCGWRRRPLLRVFGSNTGVPPLILRTPSRMCPLTDNNGGARWHFFVRPLVCFRISWHRMARYFGPISSPILWYGVLRISATRTASLSFPLWSFRIRGWVARVVARPPLFLSGGSVLR